MAPRSFMSTILGLGSDQYHNSILNSHLKYLKEVEGEAQKATEEVSLEAPLSMAWSHQHWTQLLQPCCPPGCHWNFPQVRHQAIDDYQMIGNHLPYQIPVSSKNYINMQGMCLSVLENLNFCGRLNVISLSEGLIRESFIKCEFVRFHANWCMELKL